MGSFDQIRRAYQASRERARARRAAEDRRYAEAQEPEPAVAGDSEMVHHSVTSRDDNDVPYGLRIAGAWAWRIIVVGFLGYWLLRLIGQLSLVVVPLIVALLLTALLAPAVGWLTRHGVHRTLATTIVLITGLGAVVGTLTLVISEFVRGLPDLAQNATKGFAAIRDWLKTGPLHLTDNQLSQFIDDAADYFDQNRDSLTTGALTTATTVLEVLSGVFLVLFAIFFFLRDGRSIWKFHLILLPGNVREPLDRAGVAAWGTLSSYVRATVLVAFIDAVGIGVALWILDVPFVFPLAALVFLGAFIPIVGATLSGAVAVLVALVTNGWVTALFLLAAVIAVQQVEGHLLQPLIMGRAVSVHPLAVILGIAAGIVLAGIIGALIAVPIIAVLNTAIRHLANHRKAVAEERAAAAEQGLDPDSAAPAPTTA